MPASARGAMMVQVVFDCFPGGKYKALHMSYDDGRIADRRLVELFNRHGLRGTFHLNSGQLDREGYVRSDEVATLYAGHEVSTHSVNHLCLPQLPREGLIHELLDDRRALERLVGYVVRGISYPGGGVNDTVIDMLQHLGFAYARTSTVNTASFMLPDDVYRWPMSCHHTRAQERAKAFLNIPAHWGLQLLYVMGHSFEFDRDDNWELMEDFCVLMGGRDEIWYATNIDIADYLQALRAVHVSADGDILTNPTAQPVWFSLWDESRMPVETVELPAGATVRLS